MTIEKKIIAGYALVLAIFAGILIGAFYTLQQVQNQYNHIIDANLKLLDNINTVRFEVRNQVAHYRGFLLYQDKRQEFRTKLQQDHLRLEENIRQMQSLSMSAEGLAVLDKVAEAQKKFAAGQEKIIAMMLQDNTQEALALSIDEVRPVSEALIAETDKLRDLLLERVDEQRTETLSGIRHIATTLAIVSVFGFICGLFFSFYLSRSITRKLQETITQLSSSATEILATTTQVASGSAETATAVSETTATVEEVKQTVQLAGQKAKSVSETAKKTAQISQSGCEAVEKMIENMDLIREQTASAADSIVKLSEQSQSIGEIILSVNDLAEQSNLLAVNAAIEAAKAGEHGKGFAVVAQEIKSLAEQSKQATAQVRIRLGEIQKATAAAVMATDLSGKAVEAGVKQSDVAGEAIRSLVESIGEAAQAAVQIAASSQQQMVGMDQVALAMDNIRQASAQNMAGTQQAETAAQNLHELGIRLKQLV